MKMIEKRVQEYCDKNYANRPDMHLAISMAVEYGADSERECLTRWNDPEEVLPVDDSPVLVRVNDDFVSYRIARYFKEDASCSAHWWVIGYTEAPDGFVVDWREIHE